MKFNLDESTTKYIPISSNYHTLSICAMYLDHNVFKILRVAEIPPEGGEMKLSTEMKTEAGSIDADCRDGDREHSTDLRTDQFSSPEYV